MFPRKRYVITLPGGRTLTLGERTLVMGVLNVTPDSFAELTARLDPARAADDALAMEAAGADIIDIGGESTRPGAEPIDAEEELRRVLPVVRALGSQASVPISIDTYKASVATAALGEGASIVNDISALRYDPGLGGVVARHGAALILMHNRGRSRDMYREARYGSVTREIVEELRGAIEAAENGGVARARLLVDPGLGFAKQAPHSFEALARLDSLAGLDRPIIVGPSRKSFLTRAIGEVPPQARDWGTAGAVAAAVLAGAHVVRVHAVAEMVQVVRVADEIRTAALAHRVD